MKYYTEAEAFLKWCPRARCAYTDEKTGITYQGVNRAPAGVKIDNKCLGSACMDWEEGPEVEKTGKTLRDKLSKATGKVELVATGRCGWK